MIKKRILTYWCIQGVQGVKSDTGETVRITTTLNCGMSNCNTVLNVNPLLIISSRDWSAGTGNTIGISCNYAGIVGKSGVQPQGTTTESTAKKY